jgi:hypothetical protein
MKAFREALDQIRDQIEAAKLHPPDRPTSLYAAGAVGGGKARPEHPRSSETAESTGRPREFPVEVTSTDVEARRPRIAKPVARSRPGQAIMLRAALRSPASLRTAILVSEVMEPPIALRKDRTERY